MVAEVERRKIEQALKEAAGNRGRAAETAAGQLQDADVEAARTTGSTSATSPHVPEARPSSAPPVSSFSVTSSTIVVAPIAVGSTKCSRPATIFLSCCIASSICVAETSAIGGSGPRLAIRSASACRSRSASAPRAAAELGGDEHAVGDRFAVAEAPVLRDRLERVAGGVAEVQDAARPGFALVGRDDVGLDAARLGDDRR